MSPVIIQLFDTIQEQIREAADQVTDSYRPEDGCDPGQLLQGLHTLRSVALSVQELRGRIRDHGFNDDEPHSPTEISGLAGALASKARVPS
jgi:hypothetical protein